MATPVEAEAVSSSSVISGGSSISSEVIDNTSTNNAKVSGTSHGELVGLLQNRIKSKFTQFGYLLSTKKGGCWKALS